MKSRLKQLLEIKKRLDAKCWDGYKKQGTKKKGDTIVNNCVKEAESLGVMIARMRQQQIAKDWNKKSTAEKSAYYKKHQEDLKKRMKEDTDTEEKNDMAHTQLHFIVYAAEEIMEYIMNDGEIEEWYQNKLSKVHSEMESLHAYMEGTKRKEAMGNGEEADEEINMKGCPLLEKLNPGMGIGKYIKDFKKSDAPQFKGASASKRRKMAVAAFLSAKRKKLEK